MSLAATRFPFGEIVEEHRYSVPPLSSEIQKQARQNATATPEAKRLLLVPSGPIDFPAREIVSSSCPEHQSGSGPGENENKGIFPELPRAPKHTPLEPSGALAEAPRLGASSGSGLR